MTTNAELTDYEVKILRAINGEDVPGLKWGAAMGAALELLREDGLVRIASNGQAKLTDKGRDALHDHQR